MAIMNKYLTKSKKVGTTTSVQINKLRKWKRASFIKSIEDMVDSSVQVRTKGNQQQEKLCSWRSRLRGKLQQMPANSRAHLRMNHPMEMQKYKRRNPKRNDNDHNNSIFWELRIMKIQFISIQTHHLRVLQRQGYRRNNLQLNKS